MKLFSVTGGPLFLHAGIIGLDDTQAARRKYGLKAAKKKGEYEITGTLCFKQGEIISLPVPVAKTMAHQVDPVEPEKAEK